MLKVDRPSFPPNFSFNQELILIYFLRRDGTILHVQDAQYSFLDLKHSFSTRQDLNSHFRIDRVLEQFPSHGAAK